MWLSSPRDLVQFPAGDNSSDVVINDVHYDRTILNLWNYTLYTNGTLSNGSDCWLVFKQYRPSLLPNGTFDNGTSCYSPINPIRTYGILGSVFGTLFIVSVIFTLRNLRKHGRLYLAQERRWSAVGRRWQWYWMLFLAGCGAISAFTAVDVNRNYLQSTSIILQSFFYYLMLPALLACVWESVRHWGSWQERQICDADPLSLPQDDRRSRIEFYLPLVFYLFNWLLFFMTIPHPWTAVEMQRSSSQAETVARPMALDGRFKAGALFAFAAWVVTCFSLSHSMRHYHYPAQALLRSHQMSDNSLVALCLSIVVAAFAVGYAVAGTWVWSISPLNATVSPGFLFGIGYGSPLLIVLLYNIHGSITGNDDQTLLMQRDHSQHESNHELGLDRVRQKPSWWSKMYGDGHGNTSADERLRYFASEVGGGPATARRIGEALEMRAMRAGGERGEALLADDEVAKTGIGRPIATKHAPEDWTSASQAVTTSKPGSTSSDRSDVSDNSERSHQTKAQVVRSMLDI